jgi:NADPH2:quinone reductase
MRAAVVKELGGIDRVELAEQAEPAPSAGQVLVRVHGAGVGPWDVGFVSHGFPGLALPFVPGQEIAGVVAAAGIDADVQPGDRVYGSLFPAGGGFAELAVASAERVALMPGRVSFAEAAGLVIGAGTAHEGLIDRGRLQAGETVLVTAAAGGVGSAAVQIAAAAGARTLGWQPRATMTTSAVWAPATCSTTAPLTGSSRCAPLFPAALTCCSTRPAGRPATGPSVRSATAAGRSL